MDTTVESRLSTALLVVVAILLPAGGAMADWNSMNGAMTGNAHWYGSGVAWLPVSAIVLVGAVLFAILRRKR